MTAPDLTSLANVKSWLGLTVDTDDALLGRLITAASGTMRTVCNRQDFLSASYVEVRDGTGGGRLSLANTPVTAIGSLLIDGQPIPAGAAPSTPGYLATPTAVALLGYRFSRGLANVTVAYTAGFVTLPEELEQACIDLVAWRYRERSRIGETSKVMNGQTTAFAVRDLPPSVKIVLDQYKRVVPV